MKCDEVRELLPAYVDRDLHAVGDIEVHLSNCAGCRAELEAYQSLLSDLAAMRAGEFEPEPAFLSRMLELVPGAVGDHARRVKIALTSIGGVAVGATALALVWWRLSHRGVHAAAEPESPTVA